MQGQKFLVTGGSRGIGRATVLSLVEAGADVAFTYRSNQEAAEEVVAEAAKLGGGKVVSFLADAEDYAQAKQTIESVKEALGGLDGVVLNAGINRDKLLVMMAENDWDDVISTNLKGTFNYARASVYGLIQQRSGRIVVVSSVSGLIGTPGQVNYSATKAGQIGMVRTLANEVGKFGITVNAVAPGYIKTDMWDEMKEATREKVNLTIPAGRPGTPEEVANTIRFLLSPDASYINGSVIVIDGGLSA
ncbi:3-oxoacyl-ACP reductase FabG [Paenibacillus oenotherae]|uniref:3-oxoacyl-ACP reductase FabG n=1 Tax=Paenibacillus oenotherae TaxID=1435645 RepID=A0ABS7DBG2_9BACL|nr:3-oxoacyl-ACP reductase FabG [Paenibacillus oenotherae]MBW7476946.1 3-oxoacyl-ACP reductase FabG [Paenibacillus oenotherae]